MMKTHSYESLLPLGKGTERSESDEVERNGSNSTACISANWPRRRKRHAASQFGIVVLRR